MHNFSASHLNILLPILISAKINVFSNSLSVSKNTLILAYELAKLINKLLSNDNNNKQIPFSLQTTTNCGTTKQFYISSEFVFVVSKMESIEQPTKEKTYGI